MRFILSTLLLGFSIWFGPIQAQDRATDVLSALSRQENVGADLLAAFSESQLVRVYVGVVPPEQRHALMAQSDGMRQASIAAARVEVLASLPPGSFELLREFSNVPGFAGMASPEAVLALAAHPATWRIDLDEGGSGNLVQALPLSGIDGVRSLGYSGSGITVAVVDSGLDSDHPDLADSLVAEQCFCSGGPCCPGGGATQSGSGSAEDDHGHGTNVSGIITGNGTVAPQGGAPNADIVAIKVLDSGNGFCCSSDVIAALDYIIADRPDVDVVNMSLGTSSRFADDCDTATSWTADYAQAINILRAKGVPVFVATGNNGSGVDMKAPACVANAISVGAVWDSNVGSKTILGCNDATTRADQVTCFSNSSATTDLFAPGAPTTSTGIGGATSTYSGTSQASPAAAACAALLLEETPGLLPADLEAALKGSGVMVTDSTNGLSFPRLDCLSALQNVFLDGFEPN